MITLSKKTNKGFMALMSAIIISFILLLIVTSLGFTSFYGRSNILDFELKERSSALAEACGDMAILKITNDPAYNPANESIDVANGESCIIRSVSGSPKAIRIKADYKNYITNLEIEVGPSMTVTKWEERP